jgi:2-polyprenyl-3-methyl-5-hydroxy-6-metoxy-1,4-benzoquinol methylase
MAYIRPSLSLLKQISPNLKEIALDEYCSDKYLLREFFWLRLRFLYSLISQTNVGSEHCLDFGGGIGVFAPTLSSCFKQVTIIDRNADEARRLVSRMNLGNVSIVHADIASFDFEESFDAIIAADVLEHFRELDLPIGKIAAWLKPSGVLFTSLPSENIAYRALRMIFGKEKPADHFHAAKDVERELARGGFQKMQGIYHPLYVPVLPLFYISAWQQRVNEKKWA